MSNQRKFRRSGRIKFTQQMRRVPVLPIGAWGVPRSTRVCDEYLELWSDARNRGLLINLDAVRSAMRPGLSAIDVARFGYCFFREAFLNSTEDDVDAYGYFAGHFADGGRAHMALLEVA